MGKAALKRPPAEISVNVKMAKGVDGKRVVVNLLGIAGVRKVVHLFPSEKDPELANLYLVKIRGKDRGQALRKIRRRPLVECADVAPRRGIA